MRRPEVSENGLGAATDAFRRRRRGSDYYGPQSSLGVKVVEAENERQSS